MKRRRAVTNKNTRLETTRRRAVGAIDQFGWARLSLPRSRGAKPGLACPRSGSASHTRAGLLAARSANAGRVAGSVRRPKRRGCRAHALGFRVRADARGYWESTGKVLGKY